MSTKANITIDIGTTFSLDLTLRDQNDNLLNLSDYISLAQMKKWYTSKHSIKFVTSIDASTSTVTISMPVSQTSTIEPGRYVYDVIVIDSLNNVSRVVEGMVDASPAVTFQNNTPIANVTTDLSNDIFYVPDKNYT